MAEILGKHTDGLGIGLLLAQVAKLRFDGRLQQSFVAVFYSLSHEFSARRVAIDIVSLQAFDTLVIIDRVDADAQDALVFAATHGQQTMTRTALQGFVPIKIVAVFGSLFAVGLCLDNLRGDAGCATEGATHLLATPLVLTHLFGNDVLSTLDGRCDIGHITRHKAAGCRFRVAFPLKQENLCQRLQSLFASHLGSCAAAGFEGQIDILELGSVPTIVDTLFEFWRQLVLFANSL